MSENIQNLGVWKHGLIEAMQLDDAVVSLLGLKLGRRLFDAMHFSNCLSYQERIGRSLQPLLKDVWHKNPDKNFLIVCGDKVYVTESTFKDFDQLDLANRMEYLPTVILRPTPEPTGASIVVIGQDIM